MVQARTWLDRGWTIPVAVNVSARSLHDLAFPEEVRRQLETVGVPASLLSLDDFGTGYSSMSYLEDLPVRELKIDRSFVLGLRDQEGDFVLVQSAVDLGHNLGLHVVAEGVEDATTQQALAKTGCDLVQGYHICRPASAADLDSWLSVHASTAHEANVPRLRTSSDS